jgi:hypothetical protein
MTTKTPRYETPKAIPARYNFARAMPNATLPQYWVAASTAANATHRLYRGASGSVTRVVYIP